MPSVVALGLRGIRIQNIVNELNGEKIDVVMERRPGPVHNQCHQPGTGGRCPFKRTG